LVAFMLYSGGLRVLGDCCRVNTFQWQPEYCILLPGLLWKVKAKDYIIRDRKNDNPSVSSQPVKSSYSRSLT